MRRCTLVELYGMHQAWSDTVGRTPHGWQMAQMSFMQIILGEPPPAISPPPPPVIAPPPPPAPVEVRDPRELSPDDSVAWMHAFVRQHGGLVGEPHA